MNERQIIDMLLNKELEISSKIHQSINTILRYGYDEAKCKKEIAYLIETIQYTLEDIDRVVNR